MHQRLQHTLEQLPTPFTAEELFDHLPDTVFFIKDTDGHYLCVNETLVERCGKPNKQALLGRKPTELFGYALGHSYEQQDQRVIRTGRALIDKLELHRYTPANSGWCLTSKFPLRDASGAIIGLTGTSRDLVRPDMHSDDYAQVSTAIRFAESRLARPPSLAALARRARLSIYQLDRRMKRLFGLSTGQWFLKTRIEHACRLLTDTERPITEIALECGYANTSAFTRQFRKTTGQAPSVFRTLS
ncbi:MAG: AraC family transcriptional regulator [Pseudomonadota bacterium]